MALVNLGQDENKPPTLLHGMVLKCLSQNPQPQPRSCPPLHVHGTKSWKPPTNMDELRIKAINYIHM
ncbi:hypothetical protein CR513_06564, partial [Mucuna pruriens]